LTVTVISRVAPPRGTVMLAIEPKLTAPPSPLTDTPGARKRFSVAWSPLAYARKKSGSWLDSVFCAAGSELATFVFGGDAADGAGSQAGMPDTTIPPPDA
jgi:hypothetical protein